MLSGIITVFLLNVAASTMGVLNTLLISKKYMKPVYLIMIIDAIVFTTGLRIVSNEKSFYFILAYAFGKAAGAFLANKIEEKIALGFQEVVIFEKGERALMLADNLRSFGYSVTTTKGYGINGKTRFSIMITIKRKQMKQLQTLLSHFGYDEATMMIKEVKSVSGKLKERM